MLKREDYLMILRKRQQGMLITDIAAEIGCSRRTVTRTLQRGGAPRRRRRRRRGSKLDPFKPTVDHFLDRGVWNAEVIFRELRAAGYDGGRTILWDYIRPKRRLKPSRATVRFETRPGRQLQHDWGELDVTIAGALEHVYIAVNALGFSRRFHAFAAPRQDAEHTYESLVRAFEWFGGVPEEVLVDNQRTAVLRRSRGRARFHPRLIDLAECYGFTPRACRPYRARTKGKIERLVGYLKDHFFQRYPRFDSFEHLNRCLQAWLETEADRRVHGTHKEGVIERFQRDEAKALQPLPRMRFDTAYCFDRIVGWDGYVNVEGNRYSVPDHFCGERVRCRLTLDGQLTVYGHAEEVIARHVLRDVTAGWQADPGHHRRLWREAMSVEVRDLRAYEEVT